jgi:sugar phosphate isomerase/epimerase
LKLGIVSDEISRDFSAAMRGAVSIGLRRFEVRFLKSGHAPMCDASELREVERLAREEGVEITGLAPGLFKNVTDAAGFAFEMRELYPRSAEWAKRWNLPGLIVFGFRKPGATEDNGDTISSDNPPPAIKDWLASAAARAHADGLTLMVEPEPVCWADSGPATTALLSPGMKINYDPGNVVWLERRDPLDELAGVAPYIVNMHIKDVLAAPRGSGKPQFVPAGEGVIDYRAHFTALKRIGFDGPMTLEPHMDSSVEAARRCKEAVERIWNSL